jgi:Glycerophosphoryl diester phosphodiesterase family
MKIHLYALVVIAALAATNQPAAGGQPLLITHAHAHNDYLHARPLFDALDHGFCSVEADVFLVHGKLLVGHELSQTRPARTLQALYLDPLRRRVRQNGGRVYPNGPEFTLLIDLKQDWPTIYPALRATLTNYADMLVSFRGGRKRTNAILVIISGSRDPAMFAGAAVRYAAMDGEVSDLDWNPPSTLVPWISADWKALFRWNGVGTMPETTLRRVRDIVTRAHAQGRRVRFWDAPDNLNFWRAIRAAGVDLINTDNLPGVADFFKKGG